MKLVHVMKCKVEYEISQEVVMNVKNFTKHEGLIQNVHVQVCDLFIH